MGLDGQPSGPGPSPIEVTESHEALVGGTAVRRALPQRERRTVGAWCFADHFGPAAITEGAGMDVGPHPHSGLHTVTWLVDGQVLHKDSLGSEQVIKPGQLNLMTAGDGIAHAEQSTGQHRGTLQGIQLWVAQPEATRHGRPAFAHLGQLAQAEIDGGVATVLVGELAGAASTARHDTELVGAELMLHAPASVPLHSPYGTVSRELETRSMPPTHPGRGRTIASAKCGRDCRSSRRRRRSGSTRPRGNSGRPTEVCPITHP